MNIDGRKKNIVVKQTGGAKPGTLAEVVYDVAKTQRQTRSAKPQVFYQLADADRTKLEHEQSIAASSPLPKSSWDSSNSQSEPLASRTFETSTPKHHGTFIPEFGEIDITDITNSSDSESDENTASGSEAEDMPDPETPVITGDGALLPQPFYGKTQENAEAWLSYLQRYSTYKQLTAVQTLALFKVLLRDGAGDWLVAEPDGSKDTLDHLTAAFKARFQDNEVLKYKSARDLFTMKQDSQQSVDEYVTEVVKTAQKIGQNKEDNITRYAILSGLRPEIAKHVLMADPKTTTAVIENARMAELAVRTDGTSCNEKQQKTVNNVLAEIHDQQMRQLCDEVARVKLAMSEIQANNTVRAITPTTTQRVRFAETGDRQRSPARSISPRPGTAGQRQPFNNGFNNGYGGSQQSFRQRGPQQQAVWRQSSTSFPRYRNTANNIQCRFCGIFGHKIAVCRKRLSLQTQGARRPQQNGFRNY